MTIPSPYDIFALVKGWRRLFPAVGVILVVGLLFPYRSDIQPGLPFSARSLPQELSILLPEESRGDAALALAVGDLGQVLESLGVTVKVSNGVEKIALSSVNLVLGGADSPWVRRLVEAGALDLPSPSGGRASLGEEGYLIQKTAYRGVPFLAVVGGGALGQAYGAFRLAEMLRLDPGSLAGDIRLRAEPAMTLRLVSSPGLPAYPNPQDALRWGFNAVMIEPWPGLALYDGYDPAIFDPAKHPQDRAWVESNRARARQQIAEAQSLHLKVVSMGDVFQLPRQTLALYGAQVSAEGDRSLFCIARPKTQALLSYALKEVLAEFPQIDAIMVRTGENYPLGPLAGNSPAQGSCGGLSYPERIRQTAEVVYKQVVEGSGKTYIHRAWDLWDSGIHARPEMAKAAFQGLEGKPGLIVSFKQTQTDFWRYNPVNPNLGRLAGEEMIEFQMAREYEGKGAFPNYQGELLSRGAPEVEPRGGMDYAYQRGVRAVWVWAKGGGWGGPYPTSDLWIEPNIYAAARLAWDPSLSAEQLARDWATLRFGPRAAPRIASLLLKSDDAVLLAMYIGPAAPRLGPWTPNALWLRDDAIFGEPKMADLYQLLRDDEDLQLAMAEKAQALSTIDSMIGDLEAVRDLIPDRRLAEEVLNTLRYERALAETLGHYLGGMLYYHRWKQMGNTDAQARQSALAELREWSRSWEYYRKEVASLEGVASPYQDQGMGKAAQEALKELEEAR